MPSKSKTKGSSYEREIVKFLSDTYKEPFVRVPNSGAYTGGANSHRKSFLNDNQAKSFKGDIIAPDTWITFNAECKNYADFPFHLVLAGECKQLESWLDQLIGASDTNDLNLLFIKISRKGQFVAVQASVPWTTSCNYFRYTSVKHGDWMIYSFNTFFALNANIVKTHSKS